MGVDGSTSPGWIERLQDLVNETVERSTASTANLQRLLAAVAIPGVNPEALTTELTRQGQDHGLEAYQRIAELTTRFLSRSLCLAARYRDEYLSELIPRDRMTGAGPPPTVPPPPDSSNPAAWASWYPLYTAWVTQQQAWSARLYEILIEEVSSGALSAETVQTSARAFLQRRLPDYLADMAELNAELVCDILSLADSSIERLSDALLGEVGIDELAIDELAIDELAIDELAVDVRGPAGTTTGTSLVIDNSRSEPALVSCEGRPREGFGLVTAPQQFQLAPGESRRVAIRVILPPHPTMGLVEAGSVVIRGPGDRDLVVWLRAAVEAPAAAEPAEAQPVATQEPVTVAATESQSSAPTPS